MMNDPLSLEDVRDLLRNLNHAGMHALAVSSGVSFHSILKIRHGGTKEPSYTTVIKLLPKIGEISQVVAHHSREYVRAQRKKTAAGAAQRKGTSA